MKSQSIDTAERSFFENLQLYLKINTGKSSKKTKYERICGVDAAHGEDDSVFAVASVFDTKTFRLVERSEYIGRATFAYVPGLFFLREGPFTCEALSKLKSKPDLVCFDAQGYAHPRRRGLATICGMVAGVPSIGISKSRLVGEVQEYREGLKKLVAGSETLGYVTSNPTRYWSTGFAVALGELESLIEKYGKLCVQSINESHRFAQNLRLVAKKNETAS
jgi:deoxyribonuclease V